MSNPNDPDLPSYPGGPDESAYPNYGGFAQTGGFGNFHEGADGQPMTRGSGKVDYMEAVRWGFSQTFSNWLIWILGTLVVSIVFSVPSFISGFTAAMNGYDTAAATTIPDTIGSLSSVIIFFLAPLLVSGLLYQVDHKKMHLRGFVEDLHYWKVILVAIIQILIGLAGFLLVLPGIFALVAAGEPTAGAVFTVVGGLLLMCLCIWLIYPLIMYWVPVVADRGVGIGEGLRIAVEAGKRNYGRILLGELVVGVLYFMGVLLTLGLASFILVPANALLHAHLYRQATEGPLPVEG